jgi:hypothetical protein
MIYYKCEVFVWDNKAKLALEARAVQRRNLMRVRIIRVAANNAMREAGALCQCRTFSAGESLKEKQV